MSAVWQLKMMVVKGREELAEGGVDCADAQVGRRIIDAAPKPAHLPGRVALPPPPVFRGRMEEGAGRNALRNAD
jgi:hypothetical protein